MLYRMCLSTLAALLLACTHDDATHTASANVDPAAFVATNACLDHLVAQPSASGAALAVFRGDQVLHVASAGTTAPASADEIRPTTRFRFGSVLKAMTAVALLHFVDEGRLSPSTTLAELLPTFAPEPTPSWTAQTTVHHLLSHQAGFREYFGVPLSELFSNGFDLSAYYYGPRADSALRSTLLSPEFASAVPYLLEPGLRYNYSNPNFRLAGLIVEDLAGVPYPEAMARHVFEPLGMVRSATTVAEIAGDADVAHAVTASGVLAPDAYDNAWARPGGFGWTSIDDFTRFAQFLLAGDPGVLSDERLELMKTAQVQVQSPDQLASYGYGLFIKQGIVVDGGAQFLPIATVEHGGAVLGYSAWMRLLPDENLGVVALTNGDNLSPALEACGDEALFTLVERPAPQMLTPQIDDAKANDYLGQYREPQLLGDFTVVPGDAGGETPATLRIEWAGPPLTLTPTGNDTFTLAFPLADGSTFDFPLNGVRHPDGRPRLLYNRYLSATRAP